MTADSVDPTAVRYSRVPFHPMYATLLIAYVSPTLERRGTQTRVAGAGSLPLPCNLEHFPSSFPKTTTMRTPLLFLFCLLFTLSATAQVEYKIKQGGNRDKIVGNGEVTDQDRSVADFDELSACCKIRVELTRGEQSSVSVEAESNLIDLLVTEVSGGRLNIYFAEGSNFRSREDIVVYVTVPTLTYVGGQAGAEILSRSTFAGQTMEVEASSGSTVRLDFEGDKLRATASSGASVEMGGSGRDFRARTSSGATLTARKYAAVTVDAGASSGSTLHVNVSDYLEAEASSGATVLYSGDARDIDIRGVAGGSVRKGK